jgi:peptidoglycan/LPS O-acetylase OafA/YrhL
MKYRSDIDGLRAVAVLPVVFYHFGIPGFPGGYVGVDVFFVISGYLICGLIQSDLDRGRFSIADFYERRILRILPALIAMLCVVSALAFAFFLPEELKAYLKSLLGAAASASNMYFAKTAVYFDALSGVKPLLHTWSLGVEEQFYIFAPLVMMFIQSRFPTRLKRIFIAVAILSFLFDLWLFHRTPTFAFYLMPARAWELALGGMLAIGVFGAPVDPVRKAVLGVAGLGLIALCVLLGSDMTPLPLITAAACLGAVLVIASSEQGLSPAGRLLSLRPLVFVGLISYSLYLWHWPLMVFQRTDFFLMENWPAAVTKALLLAVSLLAAWLSWKFVEIPFRQGRKRWPRATVFRGAAAALVSIMLLGAGGLILHGVPERFPARIDRIASYLSYDEAAAFRTGRCFIDGERQHYDADYCLRQDAHRLNYLLMGDSHAAHLWAGLTDALPAANILQATASICRPVILPSSLFDNTYCPRMRHLIFDDFLKTHRPDRILLSASWKPEDVAPLLHTIDVLQAQGFKVTVMGPIVEYEQPLPRILVDEIRYNVPTLASQLRAAAIPELDRRMHDLVTARGAAYVSVYDAVCPHADCENFAGNDVPLQFDTGHLTAEGSKRLIHHLVDDRELF